MMFLKTENRNNFKTLKKVLCKFEEILGLSLILLGKTKLAQLNFRDQMKDSHSLDSKGRAMHPG
jgi:hypothetical protein